MKMYLKVSILLAIWCLVVVHGKPHAYESIQTEDGQIASERDSLGEIDEDTLLSNLEDDILQAEVGDEDLAFGAPRRQGWVNSFNERAAGAGASKRAGKRIRRLGV